MKSILIAAHLLLAISGAALADGPVAIEYEARLNPGISPADVRAHFVAWARRQRVGADAQPGEGLNGVRLILHPACQGVPFGFDREGVCRGKVETGELGPGYHQAVVRALDELGARFAEVLRVEDSTGYWRDRRREALERPMVSRMAALLETALEDWPDDPSARLRTSLGEFDRPDVERWLADLRRQRRLAEHFPWWPAEREGAYWTNLGCVLYFHYFLGDQEPADADRLTRVIGRYFDRGRAEGAETWLAQYYQGLIELERDRPEAAEAWFLKALESNPKQTDVRMALGNAYLEAGETEKAIETFRRLAAEAPLSAEAQFRLGMAFNAERRWREALSHLERATELDEELASAWIEKGLALREAKRLEEALESYAQGTKLAPENPNAWYGRGAVLVRLERAAEAAVYLRQCLALAPSHYDALIELGLAHLIQKDMENAEQTFRKASRIAPKRPEAFFNLSRVYEKEGREREARLMREEAERRGYRLEEPEG